MKLPPFIKFKKKPDQRICPDSAFHPDRDWAVILSVFAALFIACAISGIFLYLKEDGKISSPSSETPAQKTAKDLRAIKEFLAGREKSGASSDREVADPSL